MKTIDCNIQITEINVGLYFDPLMDISILLLSSLT